MSQLVCWVFAYLDVLALFAHFEVILLDGTMVLWAIMTARGSRVACGAQATPRVDVDVTLGQGGHDVPPPLLLQVPGTHYHPVKTSGRFQVFVKGLAGHTLVIAGCSGDMLVDDFVEPVAMRARVPAACFYLVGAGSKALRLGTTLSDAGVVGHSLLFMAGRLQGGSSRPRPPPGSWHCYVCDMGGCWPARNTCFRCLAPRGTVPQPQSRSKPPRENQFPGRSPQPSGGGNPTYSKPAPQVASVPPTSCRSSAPVKGDALALVKALRGFGVHESVLEQVQASLVPPKRDTGNAREKALSDCKAQLHILRQRLVKQRTAVSNAQEALDRSQEKLTGLEDEVAKLDLQYRELSVDPLTLSSSKIASETGDGPHLAEVQSSTDGMDLTGQDGDLVPPELPVGTPSPGPDRDSLRPICAICSERRCF